MHIHHAGIATNDLDAITELYGDLLSVPVVHEERFDGMKIAFLDLGNGYLELLEPTEDGPIASYLDSRGPGIHHLAFETDDARAALDRARDLGITLVDEEPRPGAWGHDVAFLHPRDTGGMLVEFVEE